LVIAIWAAAVIVSLPGLSRLEIETSTDSVLDRTGQEWRFYQETIDRFGSDEIVVIGRSLEEPINLGNSSTLGAIADELAGKEHVRRIDGVSTLPSPGVDADGTLRLDPATDVALESGLPLRELVRRDRVLSSGIVSEDHRTDSLVIRMTDIGSDQDIAVTQAVRGLTGAPGFTVSGGPVFRVATNQLTQAELTVLGPVTTAVIALLIWLFFGSVRAVAVSFLVGLIAVVCTMSLMGLVGVAISITTYILPTVLIALAASYTVHVMNSLVVDGDSGGLSVARAVALSGATTAIGFVAMTFARIDVVRDVGAFGAFGAIVAMLCALTLVPALTSKRVTETSLNRRISKELLPRLARWCAANRLSVFGVWIGLGMVLGLGVSKLDLETDVVLYFPEDSQIRLDYDRIRSDLAGISPISIVIERDGASVVSADALALVADFQAAIDRHPNVGSSVSIVDPLRQINGAMLGDDSQPLPVNDASIDQYLLLLGGVDHINDLVTHDRSALQVMIRADNNGSDDLLELAMQAENWWLANSGESGIRATATGIMFEYARSERAIEDGQVAGLIFAGIAIFLVLTLVLGGPKLATIAMVPNATPVLAAFGGMGLFGIPLDAGTILVGTLALGIAVDDTIHVISAYRDSRSVERIGDAVERVGGALACTTAAVALGFAVLGLSGFALIGNLGVVTAAVMVVCLAADTTLLPALLGRRPS
jgi:hypothetical protein